MCLDGPLSVIGAAGLHRRFPGGPTALEKAVPDLTHSNDIQVND
jgi:hypothetical protein